MIKNYINDVKVIKNQIIDDEDCNFTFGTDYLKDSKYTYYDMHYELEIGIVLSGSIIRYYSNTKEVLSKGQIWLSNVWEPHRLETYGTPSEVAIFFIKPDAITNIDILSISELDWVAPFFSTPEKRPQMKNKIEKNNVLDIVRRANEILRNKSKNSNILIQLLAMELLTRIQENWIKEPIDTKKQITDYLKISPALNIIYHNTKLISIKDAAKACALSEKTFSRNFKNIMGCTFSQFSLGYRVRSSAEELINESLPIKQIVYKWGFTDESHYNKLFQKYFNCNPGEYKKFRKMKNCPEYTNS